MVAPPNTPWRFSIREILLALVAVAAVLALVAQSRDFQASPLYLSFDEDKFLRKVCEENGWTYAATMRGGGSQDSRRAVRDIDLRVQSPPPAEAYKVMGKLQTALREELFSLNCQVGGAGSSGNHEKNELSDFHLDYRHAQTYGDVYVTAFKAGDHWRLHILIHEF